jgi:hypothetical protein
MDRIEHRPLGALSPFENFSRTYFADAQILIKLDNRGPSDFHQLRPNN